MKYQELLTALSDSRADDWLTDGQDNWTYTGDLLLRIEKDNSDDALGADRHFNEAWATQFPDPTAYRDLFTVKYGPSFIVNVHMASVDGGRALIPFPKSRDDLRIEWVDNKVAEIVNADLSRYYDYLNRAGITLEKAGPTAQ